MDNLSLYKTNNIDNKLIDSMQKSQEDKLV